MALVTYSANAPAGFRVKDVFQPIHGPALPNAAPAATTNGDGNTIIYSGVVVPGTYFVQGLAASNGGGQFLSMNFVPFTPASLDAFHSAAINRHTHQFLGRDETNSIVDFQPDRLMEGAPKQSAVLNRENCRVGVSNNSCRITNDHGLVRRGDDRPRRPFGRHALLRPHTVCQVGKSKSPPVDDADLQWLRRREVVPNIFSVCNGNLAGARTAAGTPGILKHRSQLRGRRLRESIHEQLALQSKQWLADERRQHGGLLTDGVDQHPHCVLLLDEIEKAHPDLFNILLQVMDHGTLTDANGKKVDFRNVILIMTTNAGAADSARHSIGFGRGKKDEENEEAIKRLFTPEFRNRLDAVIRFDGLPPEIIRTVVQKFVLQLEAQLSERHVTIELSDAAADWLAKRGFDEAFGARPLQRIIQEHVKKPMADELLFGSLKDGGVCKVDIDPTDDDKLKFTYISEAKPKPAEPKKAPVN